MAKKNIYEIPGGRKRRPGRSTNYRTATKESIDKLNKSSQTLGNNVKYSAVETAFISTSGFGVEAPWKEKTNFKFTSDVASEYEQNGTFEPRNRGEVSTPFSKEEIDSFIEETARALQDELGIENVDIRTVYGNYDIDHENARVGGTKFGSDNHIEIYPETVWRNLESGYYPDVFGDPAKANAKNFYDNLRETMAHEMRHVWQYTSEEGKTILEAQTKYKAGEKVKKYRAKVNKKWSDDFKEYWQEPVEVDARRTAKKYRSRRKGKKIINKYRKKLEQKKINEQKFREKLEEIQTRPKNRIIGHEEDGTNSTGSRTQSNETTGTTSGPETTPQPETAPDVNPEPETEVETQPEANTPDPEPDVNPDPGPETSSGPEVNPGPETSTTSTPEINTGSPETNVGPQPGDAYWDKKHNRQLIYDGPDEQWGGSRFLTREGQIVNDELDNLVKYNGTRKLDYGVLKSYNKELDNFNQLIDPNNKLKFSNPEEYYKQLTNSINSIDLYEKYVQGQYNKFKGNKDYHKNRKFVAKDINSYFGKDVINMDPLNLKKNKNKDKNNTNKDKNKNTTRRNLSKEEQEAVDRANEAWRRQKEKEFEQREKEIEEQRRRTEEIFGSPEEIESDDYRSNFDPEPDVSTVQTVDGVVGPEYGGVFQKKFDPNDPKTWREEDFEYLKDTDPDYYNELINEMNEAQTVKFDMNDPTTWTAEDFEYLKDTDPDYYNELIDQMNEAQKYKINFDESPFHNVVINEGPVVNKNINTGSTSNTSTGSSNTGSSNTGNPYGANIPSGVDPNDPATWTDEYIKLIANGDPDIADEMIERRAKALGKNKPNTGATSGGTPNTGTSSTGSTSSGSTSTGSGPRRTNAGGGAPTPNVFNMGTSGGGGSNGSPTPNVFNMGKGGPTPAPGIPNPGQMPIVNPLYNTQIPSNNPILNTPGSGQGHKFSNGGNPTGNLGGGSGGSSKLGKLSKMEMIGSAVNIIGAIGDYKAARREGRGVIASGVDAAARFAIGEALGWLYFPMELLRMAPGAIIKGSEMLYQENRRMNSAANMQVFGGAQFQDSQQLATMRQSGMEMAKMAQYNLQQTLMGNEAQYLHR